MKIDIFPHIFPRRFYERMLEAAPPNLYMQKRVRGIPVLVDLDERLRIMDRYEGYVQVLTLASPAVIPPADVVAAFEHSASPLDSQIENNDKQSRTLAALRDTLLPKLISGELRVMNSERFVGTHA